MKKIKTLIVAAYNNELNHLYPLGKKYQVIKNNTAYLSAGIGPVAATFGLSHFLEDYRPEIIISINTAGSIDPNIKIGDITLARSVSTISGLSSVYSPKKAVTLHHNTNPKHRLYAKKLGNINKVSVFCPQEISKKESIRQELFLAGHEVENLEAYAFTYVAKKLSIPIISILGITNEVGPNGSKEWKKNEEKLCKKMSLLVKKLMRH